jgi:hypothetical protein
MNCCPLCACSSSANLTGPGNTAGYCSTACVNEAYQMAAAS